MRIIIEAMDSVVELTHVRALSQIVSACAASDKTIQPTCTQGATTVGDAFKTQMDSVGTRTASGTSSVWAPSLALLATVLLTTAGAILA